MSQGFAKKDYDAPGWQAWDPHTFATNLTEGNGTTVAEYIQIGTLVVARFQFTLGSTSAVASGPRIGLPVTAAADYEDYQRIGNGMHRDIGGNISNGHARLNATSRTTVEIRYFNGATDTGVTAVTPFTWATGDYMTLTLVYEAASPAITNLEVGHFHTPSVPVGRYERITSDQSIADSTFDTVIYNSAVFESNVEGAWEVNTSTGVITFNQSGIYEITASVRWSNFNDGRTIVAIRDSSSGTFYGRHEMGVETSGTGLSPTVTATTIVQVSAGDTYDVLAYQEQATPASENATADEETYLFVKKLG